jgi:hypothetical protein
VDSGNSRPDGTRTVPSQRRAARSAVELTSKAFDNDSATRALAGADALTKDWGLFSTIDSQTLRSANFSDKVLEWLEIVDVRDNRAQRPQRVRNVLQKILMAFDETEKTISTERLHEPLHRA